MSFPQHIYQNDKCNNMEWFPSNYILSFSNVVDVLLA